MLLEALKSDRLLLAKTSATSMAFFAIAYSIAVVGPTLLDLQLIVNSTVHETATIVPSRAIGRALGSIIASFLPESTNEELVLALSLLGSSAGFIFAPRVTTIYALDTVLLLAGIFMGIAEISCNLSALRIWPEYATRLLQLCAVFFGIGSVAAPLIAQPFLLPTLENNVTQLKQNETLAPVETKVHYVYDILSVYSFAVSAFLFVLSRISRHDKTYESTDILETTDSDSRASSLVPVYALVCLALNLEFGIYVAFTSMLELFVVEGPPRLSKSTGAFMTAGYSFSCTFFKSIALVMLAYTTTYKILVFHLGLLLVGNVLFAVSLESEFMLWISISVVGIGFSSLYSLLLGYVQQYFKVGFTAMSVFLLCQCIGDGLYPLLIADTIKSWPSAFVIVTLSCSGLLCVVVACIHLVCRKLPERDVSSDHS